METLAGKTCVMTFHVMVGPGRQYAVATTRLNQTVLDAEYIRLWASYVCMIVNNFGGPQSAEGVAITSVLDRLVNDGLGEGVDVFAVAGVQGRLVKNIERTTADYRGEYYAKGMERRHVKVTFPWNIDSFEVLGTMLALLQVTVDVVGADSKAKSILYGTLLHIALTLTSGPASLLTLADEAFLSTVNDRARG